MFKFETVVYTVLVMISLASGAQDRRRGEDRADKCTEWQNRSEEQRKSLAREMFPRVTNEADRLAKASERMCSGGSEASNDTCREAEKAFNEAAGAFEGACGDAGLPRNDRDETNRYKEGAIGCSWSINRCRCLEKKPSPEDVEKYECNSGSRSRRSSNSANQGIGLIDLGKAEQRMEFCPQADPDDTERYEKQLKDSQDRIRDLRKEMPKITDKASEAQDKAAQAQNEAARKAADAQKEFANEMKEIKRKQESDEQQAVAEITATREKMDQLDAQIRQLELNKVTAEVELSEARTQIELNCHTQASQQVSALQAAKMSAIKQGQSQGSFNRLMNSVGVSSRAAWEKRANVFYKRCLISRPTRESKTSAQRSYENKIRQIDSAISTARIQRRSIEENLKQIMSSNGCAQSAPIQANGMTGESRMCRSLRQAQEDARQAYNNQMQQQQLVQQEMATAQQQEARKNQSLRMEYAEAQRELSEEQSRMDNLRAYLNLRRERKQNTSGKKDGGNLGETYGKLRAAARTFDGCCHSQGWQDTNPKCKTVMNFMVHLGEISSQKDPIPPATPPTPPRPELSTPRTPPTPGSPAAPPTPSVRETTP